MKTFGKVILLFCGLLLAVRRLGFAADGRKARWQATWEKTLAAAKKEGRLNFYVGRYGSEPLLNEFRKEFPEIKLVTVNGDRKQLGNEDHH